MTLLRLCLTAYPVTGGIWHEWFGIGMTAGFGWRVGAARKERHPPKRRILPALYAKQGVFRLAQSENALSFMVCVRDQNAFSFSYSPAKYSSDGASFS